MNALLSKSVLALVVVAFGVSACADAADEETEDQSGRVTAGPKTVTREYEGNLPSKWSPYVDADKKVLFEVGGEKGKRDVVVTHKKVSSLSFKEVHQVIACDADESCVAKLTLEGESSAGKSTCFYKNGIGFGKMPDCSVVDTGRRELPDTCAGESTASTDKGANGVIGKGGAAGGRSGQGLTVNLSLKEFPKSVTVTELVQMSSGRDGACSNVLKNVTFDGAGKRVSK